MSRRRKAPEEPAPEPLTEEEMAAAGERWGAYCEDLAAAVLLATGSVDGIAGKLIAGRLPALGDDVDPWESKGWLLPYVMDLIPGPYGMPGRWGYWLRTRLAGRLLDEPIPRIGFHADVAGPGQAAVMAGAEILGRRLGYGAAVPRLIEWLAWGLAVAGEAPRIPRETAEELYKSFDAAALLSKPGDYLGWLMCEFKGRAYDPSGFFPTPLHVCELMAAMSFHDVEQSGKDQRRQTVNDPCVGTGRMLLAASNYSLRLSGQDINPTCISASLVNGALFAPWMSFPFPASFFATMEETSGSDGAAEPKEVSALSPPPPEPPAITWDDRGQGQLFA